MEEDEYTEPRAINDSRTRKPHEQKKEPSIVSEPGKREGWQDFQPTKTMLFWACVVSIALTMLVGFNWGGWVTAATAESAAETMAEDAVVQRLVPICVSQFNMDPDSAQKVSEMNELTTHRQRVQFVQDGGWATISGEERPDRKVADACTRLVLE